MSSIIKPVLDLTRYAWTHRHGDLKVYGTWRYDSDEKAWVPCMVIVPAFRRIGFERTTPCIVTLDLAWIWSEESGDKLWAESVAMDFCDALGLAHNRENHLRIESIIRDHLEDLLKRVPPRPRDRTVVAEAVLTMPDGNKQSSQIEEDAR